MARKSSRDDVVNFKSTDNETTARNTHRTLSDANKMEVKYETLRQNQNDNNAI